MYVQGRTKYQIILKKSYLSQFHLKARVYLLFNMTKLVHFKLITNLDSL